MSLATTQFLVDLVIIDDIVPVLAAGRRLQIGRGVDVRDTKLMEIVGDPGGSIEPEVGVQLQPVGCDGYPRHSQ